MAATAVAPTKEASPQDDPTSAAPPAEGRPPQVQERPELAPLLLPSLYRLTEGLPRRELKMMVSEARICEEALEKEIQDLQVALELEETQNDQKANPSQKEGATPMEEPPSVAMMLESEVTPPDRFFTVSALLGRLRDDLATPLPPNSALPALRAKASAAQTTKKKKKEATPAAGTSDSSSGEAPTPKGDSPKSGSFQHPIPPITSTPGGLPTTPSLEKQKRVLSLYQIPEYNREHAEPTALLSLWKKISTHRSSIVFRRPVNPKEAPGYTDRIFFPMDLALIRKMIIARQIKTYSQLHQRMGLIAHNCVKYNGRESDYGLVTREFEANVDEMVVSAVAAGAAEAARLRKTATPPIAAATSNPTANPPSAAPAVALAGTKRPTPASVTLASTVPTKQAKTVGESASLSTALQVPAPAAGAPTPPILTPAAATTTNVAASATQPSRTSEAPAATTESTSK